MPDAREELNTSAREEIIESRHLIKSLKGMVSRSNDIGAERILILLIVTLFQMKKKLW